MKALRQILLFICLSVPLMAQAGESSAFNAKEVIFGHLNDAYEWHITTIGDKHVSIPLPVILYSERAGWNMFSSSVFHHADEHNGFYIAKSGDAEGKVVELSDDGKERRPLLDISITKNVLAIFFNAALLLAIVLLTSRWYKKRNLATGVPRGFVGFMEMLVTLVLDSIVVPNLGKNASRFAPYLLSVFFFILLSNIMGLVPIFPGGANVTGNIAVTLGLSLCTFVVVNLFGNREYWKEILWPDVPTWLKVPVPLMPLIEFVGVFVKPFALTVRLFANIFAGHTALLVFVCLIFITAAVNEYLGGAMTIISVFFTVFMNFLELLVAFIQAFVFTMLSAVFIGLAHPEHHAGDKH